MVAHVRDPSTQEVKGALPCGQGYLGLQNKVLTQNKNTDTEREP